MNHLQDKQTLVLLLTVIDPAELQLGYKLTNGVSPAHEAPWRTAAKGREEIKKKPQSVL